MLVVCRIVVLSVVAFGVLNIGGLYDDCVSEAHSFVDIVVIMDEECDTCWILMGDDVEKITFQEGEEICWLFPASCMVEVL